MSCADVTSLANKCFNTRSLVRSVCLHYLAAEVNSSLLFVVQLIVSGTAFIAFNLLLWCYEGFVKNLCTH